MVSAFSAILEGVGISPAEYAVLFHVKDTVVQPRDVIADWTAKNLPNVVLSNLTFDDCLHAVDSLIRRGLLIELSSSDIEADLARWRIEPLPVSWQVDRNRGEGDVDITENGFRLMEAITLRKDPEHKASPSMGYNDETPGLIRVFGETEAAIARQVKAIVARVHEPPWRWSRDAFHVEALKPLGPWWHDRFELVPTGFEVVIRRTDRSN